MHKNKKTSKKKKPVQVQKKQLQQVSLSFFDRINELLGRHDLLWFAAIFGITLLNSFLLYDPRVSAGGDDSGYILAAHDFLHQQRFPAFQAPLYPIALSVIDLLFGMSLAAFKAFSAGCILAFVALTFFAYRRLIPPLLLFITLLLTSINSHVLYYASQTYSEAFYMLMQSLLPLLFFKYFINDSDIDKPIFNQKSKIPDYLLRFLLLGITLVGIVMARNIGYAALLTVIAFFICYRKWLNAGRAVLYFVICMAGVNLLKMMLWENTGLQGSEQVAAFLYKDLYRPEYGRETLIGFLERFWVNSNQYLSRFFMAMLGFRESITSEGVFSPVKPTITVIVYLLGLVGIYFSHRNNKALFFTGLFAGISIVATFFIVHTFWNQSRMIVTNFPMLIMVLFGALYYFLDMKPFKSFQIVLLVPFFLVFFCSLSDTVDAVKKAQKLTDEYSELTPDWRHYLTASAWAGENLPDSALVACRQPAISSIYAKGKRFYRIGRVNSSNFQGFLDRWATDETYIAIDSKTITEEVYPYLIRYYRDRAVLGSDFYLILENSETLKEDIENHMPNIRAITSVEEFKTLTAQADNQLSVFYADSLLAPLRRANVTHLIAANLRLNPYIKDGNTINTVERTAMFIQEKYPNIFTFVQRFGENNDEPADIFQINWELVEE